MPAVVKSARILDSIAEVNKPTKKSGVTIGHEFSVEIEVEDIRNCVLEWWERTDKVYSKKMTANAWCDMYLLEPNSDVFAPWNREQSLVPLGRAKFELFDPPGILVDETDERELLFEIRVKENNMSAYAEPNSMRYIRARQVLRSNPIQHEFEILENNALAVATTGPPTWR